jgi:P-type Mg2+ transporter
LLIFGLLLFWVRATPVKFRTGWFVESLLTELVIALVVRTRRPFFRSRPGRWLWLSTLTVSILTLLIPYLPFAHLLGFTPLPLSVMLLLVAITALYVVVAEIAKQSFYRANSLTANDNNPSASLR